MTRAHAIRMLLAHGDMTVNDLVDCTRWSRKSLWRTLNALELQGHVARFGYTFGLPSA